MKKLFFYLAGQCLSIIYLVAQPLISAISDGQPSTGTWSRIFNSPVAPFENPAAFASLGNAGILVVSRRPFFIKELSEVRFFAVSPLSSNSGAGMAINRFGNHYFNEVNSALGYGMKIRQRWQIGISFQYFFRKIRGNGSLQGMLAATGLQWRGKGFSTGLFINYGRERQFHGNDQFFQLGAGLGKDWSDQLYTDGSVYYSRYDGLVTSISLQYQLLSAWRLAIRLQTHPIRYGFETGYFQKAMSLRICSNWHPQLGWSPGLVLGYSAKHKKSSDEQVRLY